MTCCLGLPRFVFLAERANDSLASILQTIHFATPVPNRAATRGPLAEAVFQRCTTARD